MCCVRRFFWFISCSVFYLNWRWLLLNSGAVICWLLVLLLWMLFPKLLALSLLMILISRLELGKWHHIHWWMSRNHEFSSLLGLSSCNCIIHNVFLCLDFRASRLSTYNYFLGYRLVLAGFVIGLWGTCIVHLGLSVHRSLILFVNVTIRCFLISFVHCLYNNFCLR